MINCLFCNQPCQPLIQWDIFVRNRCKQCVVEYKYNKLNPIIYWLNSNYLFTLKIDLQNNQTIFYTKLNYDNFIKFDEAKNITPSNVDQWVDKILKLKAFL
jgi:hypothetical protein